MNVRLLQMAALAGLIAATGCSKDEDDTDGGADAKVDTGVEDGGVEDMGPADMGPTDRGTPDAGDNTGMEGFGCTSTLGMNDTMFKQDNCMPC